MTANPRRTSHIVQAAVILAGAALLAAASFASTTGSSPNLPLHVAGDAIPDPIDGAQGSAARGRALFLAHDAANCILCHALSDPGVRFAGNLGPPLDGIGRRFSVAQLRLRVADNLRINPATIMPSYYRVEGLDRVAAAYRGKPVLDAGQIEDIVAYLATLK